ncbi:Serine protease inhibitor Kazal-type 5 [Phytophthora ramorum]
MNAKAEPNAKKSSEDKDGVMETWWKDSKYKGTDYMDVLAKDEVKPVHGASKTPHSPLVAQHTWVASMTLRK